MLPAPLPPSRPVCEIMNERSSDYMLDVCFGKALPPELGVTVHRQDVSELCEAFLIEIWPKPHELASVGFVEGANDKAIHICTRLGTRQSGWVVTYDPQIGHLLANQEKNRVVGINFRFRGPHVPLPEIYSHLQKYYNGDGKKYFGGFVEEMGTTKNGQSLESS